MGGVQSGSDAESDAEAKAPLPVPETIVVSRRVFQTHMQGHAFSSWEELVQSLPGPTAPQGQSESIVKCDPMQIFAWVSTFLIQISLWGLVVMLSMGDIWMGLAVAVVYGAVLWLCVDRWLPPSMAGMLWPNLPVVVGAVGVLSTWHLPGDDTRSIAAKALFFSVLPATASAAAFMRRLPEDPDRAVLMTNLFLGSWATVCLLFSLCTGRVSFYWNCGSLLLAGVSSMLLAYALFLSPGRWGSVELVSWTLNVGVLAVAASTALICTRLFGSDHPDYELAGWLPWATVAAVLGFVGMRLGRTLPVLVSAISLASIAVRLSVLVGSLTNSTIAGICSFGVLGIAVIAATQYVCKHSAGEAEGRQVYS